MQTAPWYYPLAATPWIHPPSQEKQKITSPQKQSLNALRSRPLSRALAGMPKALTKSTSSSLRTPLTFPKTLRPGRSTIAVSSTSSANTPPSSRRPSKLLAKFAKSSKVSKTVIYLPAPVQNSGKFCPSTNPVTRLENKSTPAFSVTYYVQSTRQLAGTGVSFN